MSTKNNRSPFCIFPNYRYCGPGCSGPGQPYNDVDGCCQAHDRCLEKHSQCYCDRKFLECLRPKAKLTTSKGRIATLMYIYMKVQTVFTCKDQFQIIVIYQKFKHKPTLVQSTSINVATTACLSLQNSDINGILNDQIVVQSNNRSQHILKQEVLKVPLYSNGSENT